jgi:hypothetical protein
MQDREWRPEGREQIDAIRAADADREAIAELLRKHHIEGRLTDEEYDGRLEQCMSAKTLGELRTLVADLPGERRTPEHVSAWRRRAPFGVRLLPVLIALALILGTVGRHAAWYGGGPRYGFPWLLFVAIAGLMFLRGRWRCAAGRAHRV